MFKSLQIGQYIINVWNNALVVLHYHVYANNVYRNVCSGHSDGEQSKK